MEHIGTVKVTVEVPGPIDEKTMERYSEMVEEVLSDVMELAEKRINSRLGLQEGTITLTDDWQ